MYYQALLVAVPMPESVAQDKGIRRAADKVGSMQVDGTYLHWCIVTSAAEGLS